MAIPPGQIDQMTNPATGDVMFMASPGYTGSVPGVGWNVPFSISPYGSFRTGTVPMPPQGRLSNVALTPLNNVGAAGALSHFYTGYKGRGLPLWDGIGWNFVDPGADLSQLLTDATKSPAAAAASTIYDIFGWLDLTGVVPVPRATRGGAWTTNTAGASARGAANQLGFFNGMLTNAGAVTNGPAANAGTYLGTIYVNAAGTGIDFIHGALNTAAFLGVWNFYNSVLNTERVVDSAADTAYNGGVQQSGAQTYNKVSYVMGTAADSVLASNQTIVTTGAVAGNGASIGIGDNVTNAFDGVPAELLAAAGAAQTASLHCHYTKTVGDLTPGFNFIASCEASIAAAANFNVGSNRQLTFLFPM